MKRIMLLGGALMLAAGATRADIFSTNSGTLNATIPDGNPTGFRSDLTIANLPTSPPFSDLIQHVSVTLNISGGFNGDLYAYVVAPNGNMAVLLNRIGRSAGNTFGYGDGGLNLTLDDSAANNIHTYQAVGNFATLIANGSSWQPDGRTNNPSSVLNTDNPNGAALSLLNGGHGDGTWTLFLVDLAEGDQSTLVNWGLVVAVPEPAVSTLIVFGLGLGTPAFRRISRRRDPAS